MSYGHASDLAQRVMGRNLTLEAENARLEHQLAGVRKVAGVLRAQRDAARGEARRLRAAEARVGEREQGDGVAVRGQKGGN